MQIDMFNVEDNHEKSELDILLKNYMIKEIANEILTKPNYRDYLLNSELNYSKTINFISSAVTFFESEEKYEICSKLIEFEKEILKKLKG